MKTPEEKKIIPSCIYCIYGTGKSECRKRVEARGKNACFRFKYDPLLRVPKPPRVIPDYSEDEFKL
ncbi:MAG TPA: hypothetical protein PK629_09900 [Oscillospiraceae bacterium]|nr:hypothetical protein [Oscillospiraceae bacterium]HPF54921.1 hypothetical protein [Clostridiales bacterium]HPK34980.1 hypothetical protein [Oscillospiraceae bacterium]HPR75538.1 hypothetical protein [Oscillospiraceae bacterium]